MLDLEKGSVSVSIETLHENDDGRLHLHHISQQL